MFRFQDLDDSAAHRRVRLLQRVHHRGFERLHCLHAGCRLQSPLRQRQVTPQLRGSRKPQGRIVLRL
jgi:hypothetical protein